MSGRKKSVISKASPHTIKKFELIEEYIKSWAQKLLLTESCNGLIFIACATVVYIPMMPGNW